MSTFATLSSSWTLLPRLLALAVVAVPHSQILAQSERYTAEIAEISGRVEVKRASSVDDRWVAGKQTAPDSKMSPHDEIRTGAASRALILLHDTGRNVLLEILARLHFSIPGAGEPVNFTEPGSYRIFGRRADKDWQVLAHAVAASVRKTDFTVRIGLDGEVVIRVVEGEIEAQNRNDPANVVTITTGETGWYDPKTRRLSKVSPFHLAAVGMAETFLYYPGILHLEDLTTKEVPLSMPGPPPSAVARSILSYSVGNLPKALEAYPTDREPTNNAERLFLAAIVLVGGEYPEALRLVGELSETEAGYPQHKRIGEAMMQAISAVQGRVYTRADAPRLATEWLAESYYQQSRVGRSQKLSDWEGEVYRRAGTALERALIAATNATPAGSTFGFGWVRRAELEFGFGRLVDARSSLDQAGTYASENAQASVLKGLLAWAGREDSPASTLFQEAAQLDPWLGNAWLAMGLSELRREGRWMHHWRSRLLDPVSGGLASAGLRHLEEAVHAEPERSLLRSYLGKALYEPAGRWGATSPFKEKALTQLDVASRLDPYDPTPYLYSALIKQQENQLNGAIRDLEESIRLNDRRQVYRSSLLLDQDEAVRSANLAAAYRDAGLTERGVLEAANAVQHDYSNPSAHLFLANSYDALRDPGQVSLRYETPWLNELLLYQLLAPVDVGNLSQTISQQEYSRMFQTDRRLGGFVETDYLSEGSWRELASQYGLDRDVAYSVDYEFRSDNGQRPNADLESHSAWITAKYQPTPSDTFLIQGVYYNLESGDRRQYLDLDPITNAWNSGYHPRLRSHERHEPHAMIAYHHEWSPGQHSLALGGFLNTSVHTTDPTYGVANTASSYTNLFDLDYELEPRIAFGEFQHVLELDRHQLVFGLRAQFGTLEMQATLANIVTNSLQPEMGRIAAYVYDSWRIQDWLQLTLGMTYDYLNYPLNVYAAPILEDQAYASRFLPKAGVLASLSPNVSLRAVYAQSLGGVTFDQSYRLEPAQIAGIPIAFRSTAPESVFGSRLGEDVHSAGVILDAKSPFGTYLTVAAQWIESDASDGTGAIQSEFAGPRADRALELDWVIQQYAVDSYYREGVLSIGVQQLIGNQWECGIRYAVTQASLSSSALVPDPIAFNPEFMEVHDDEATLQTLEISARWNSAWGLFARAETIWRAQTGRLAAAFDGFLVGSQALDEDFFQINLFAGYRLPRRRGQIEAGILNLADQDYRIYPLNSMPELPRSRTFAVSFRVEF